MRIAKQTTALITAAFLACAVFSGCNNEQVDSSAPPVYDPSAREIADEYFSADVSDFTQWSGIAPETVIASVSTPEHIPELDVTFGEFFDEYMYYLAVYGITDDTSENYEAAAKQHRANIINYMTYEKIYTYAAKQDYGISPDTMTKEQLDEVRSTADSVRNDWETEFYTAARAKLGSEASEESVDKLCGEALDLVLEKCGITRDIFYDWEMSSKIEELTVTEVLKNAGVTDEQVEKALQDLISEAKKEYENDRAAFETNGTYKAAYLPEGTRIARHIFLKAENGEITDEMKELAKEVSVTLRKVFNGISGMPEFSELTDKYGGEDEHVVLADSTIYSKEYIETLYGIEKSSSGFVRLETDEGIYFIDYVRDADVSQNYDSLRKSLGSSLRTQAQTNAQIDAFNDWLARYKYTIDCDTLKIDPDSVIIK